jgi:hypothetical protein
VHRGGISYYVRYVILTAVKHRKNCKGISKETGKRDGCKRLLDVFQFLGISRRNRILNSRSVFKLRSNWGKI